jgi:hypothetical protein
MKEQKGNIVKSRGKSLCQRQREIKYAKGNKGGKGGPSKFKPEYIEIATRLCERGLTDAEIAEVLNVSEPTIHAWKLNHEEFALALQRSKGIVDAEVKDSLLKRAKGFTRKVQKATASGKVVTIEEYYPPDVRAQQLWLQARDAEFKPVQEHKHTLTADDAFLRFLEHCEAQGKAEQAKLIEHQVEDAVVIENDPAGE